MTETRFKRFSEIPAGIYRLRYDDIRSLEERVLSVAGGSLFGFDTGATSNTEAFFWGSQAALYFAFDNIRDELAIGSRTHGDVDEASDLLRLVGLGSLVEQSAITSPFEISGGQQQRLLAALLLSRRVSHVVALDALIYVERKDRRHLINLVAEGLRARDGVFLVAPHEDSDLLQTVDGEVTILDSDLVVHGPGRASPQRKSAVRLPSARGRQVADCDRTPVLEVQGLAWHYENDELGVSVDRLAVAGGRVYAVCGPNGGGKSSLLRLLASNWRPTHPGELRFHGARVRNPYKDLVRKGRLRVLFQDPNLHAAGVTVHEFVGPAAQDTLEQLGIGPYLALDLLAAPLWVRQVASFFQVASSPDDVIVLDEPLDGLAYEIAGVPACRLIRERAEQGAVVLLITHRAAMASAVADSYVWIEEKRVYQHCVSEAATAVGLGEWISHQ